MPVQGADFRGRNAGPCAPWAPGNSHCAPKNFIGFSLWHTDHFIFSSTLLTLSSSDWTLSVRVPTRSVRRQRKKVLIFSYHARAAVHLLPDDVAEHTTFLVEEILLRPFQFLHYVDGKNRQRNQLRVCVLQRRSGRFPMILKNQDVLEPAIFLQIQDSVPEGPQDIFDAFGRQSRQAGRVVGSLDDDFMCPDPIHAIKHSRSEEH